MGDVAKNLFKKGLVEKRKAEPKEGRGLIDWLFLAPQEAMSGAIRSAERGENPITGAVEGVQQRVRPSEVLSDLERQNALGGFFNPQNPIFGSEKPAGLVTRTGLDIFADPYMLAPYLGFTKFKALTKAGRATEIAPQVAGGLRAAGKPVGLRPLLRGEAKLTTEEVAGLDKRLQRAYKLVNEQALKSMKRDGRWLPAKLGETTAERVRLKQQRVAGFTGPAAAAAVESASNTLAAIGSLPIIREGVGATRFAVQNVFGRWLDKEMQGMRDVKTIRDTDRGRMAEEYREKLTEMAALQKRINPEQTAKLADFAQNVWPLDKPKTITIEIQKAKPSPKHGKFSTLQRWDTPGAELSPNKPHGLYLSPGSVKSPHAAEGMVRHDFVATHKNPLDVTHFPKTPIREGAEDSGAGAKALAMLEPQTFERLMRVSGKDLVTEAQKHLPGVDVSKYFDRQEIIEAVGATIARNRGFDSIVDRSLGSPEFAEFVALKKSAVSRTIKKEVKADPGTFVRLKTDDLPSVTRAKIISGELDVEAEIITQIGRSGKIKRLAKPFRVKASELNPNLGFQAEHPVAEHLADLMASNWADEARVERALGVLDNVRGGYVPVMMNPKVMKLLDPVVRKISRGNAAYGKVYSTFLANNKARKMGEISFEQFNNAMREAVESGDILSHQAFMEIFKEPSFVRSLARVDPAGFGEIVLKHDLFVTNPTLMTAMRGSRHITAVTNAQAIDNALRAFGVPFLGTKEVKISKILERKTVDAFLRENPHLAFYVPYKNYFKLFDPAVHPTLASINKAGLMEITANNIDDLVRAGSDAKKLGEVTGFFIPRKVANDLNRVHAMWSSPQELNKIVAAWDNSLNFFKMWTLLPIPAFYARNAAVDIGLAYAAGMGYGHGPRRVASMVQNFHEAGTLMLAHVAETHPKFGGFLKIITGGRLGNPEILDANKILTYHGAPIGTGRKVIREAMGGGLWGKGWQSDFIRGFENQYALLKQFDLDAGSLTRRERMMRLIRLMIGQDNPLIKALSSLGSFAESQIRLGALLDQYKKGKKSLDAFNWLREHMYTFQEVTRFDRVVKRVWLFWQWKKFEIPAIFEVLMKHPEIIPVAKRAVRAFYEGVGPESESARLEWIKNAYGIPMGKKNGEVGFFLGKYWIPGSGLFDLFRPRSLMEEVGPPWKPLLEEFFNEDIFFGRPIARDVPGETGYIGPMVIPDVGGFSGKRIAHIIKNTLPLRLVVDAFERMGGIRGESRPDPERGYGTPLEIMMKTLGLRLYYVKPDALPRAIDKDMKRISKETRNELRNLNENGEHGRAKHLHESYINYIKEARKKLQEARKKK